MNSFVLVVAEIEIKCSPCDIKTPGELMSFSWAVNLLNIVPLGPIKIKIKIKRGNLC